jgi:hypothetical protein
VRLAPSSGRAHEPGTRAGFVTGHVRWHDGAPAAGARVHWFATRAGRESSVASALVAGDGSYRLGPLPAPPQGIAGRCLAAYPSDPLPVSGAPMPPLGAGRARQQRIGVALGPGQVRTDVDLVLLRDDQIIAGTVRGPDDVPVAGALVWATQQPGDWNENESGRPRVVSDRNGHFVIKAVPAGEYELRALHPRFPLARKPGVVAGSETVAIALAPAAFISGQVLDGGGGPGGPVRISVVEALAPGAPGRAVTAETTSLHWLFAGPTAGQGTPTFTVGPLAPGDYHIQVRGPAGSALLSGVELRAGQWRQGVRLTVGSAATARAEVTR